MTDRITFTANVTAEGRRIRGSIVLAGQRTRRNGEWLEVDPAAIVKADAADIVGRWEHDPHKILGRPSNGTLSLSRTDQGIEYELTDLPETTYANDALALVRGGYVTGSSFEIEGIRSTFSTDPETGERIRRITHIDRLTDVSPVGQPAFMASTAAAFSEESEVTAPNPEVEAIASAAPAQFAVTGPVVVDDKSDFYRRAESFARDKSLTDLEAFMENLVSDGLDTDAKRDQYDAFASVYDDRKKADAETRGRMERIALAHQMRLGHVPKGPKAEAGLYESEDYRHAFGKYLRTGEKMVMEQFAQSIAGDGSQGGYMVPDGSPTRIIETLKAYGGIQRVADTITTADGRSLPWVTNDDTGNSAVIATEGAAAASAGADLVFGDGALGAFSYDATGTGNVPLLVSKELLQDAAFDVEAYVGRKLGERLGRKMAADFATGTGTGEPFGLLAKTPDAMTATTTRAASVEHVFQVDAAYRDGGNCRWIMSDTTLVKYWSAVDKEGRPLFQPASEAGGQAGIAGMLAGYPVVVDNGAGNLVAFGDIRLGYIIRYVRGVEINVDPYTAIKSRQIAYHAWARADAQVQDAAAYSVSDYSTVSADTAA